MTWAVITVTILGVVALVSGIFYIFSGLFEDENTVMPSVTFWVSTIAIFLIFTGFLIASNKPIIQDNAPYQTRYLYALEDNNLTTGRGYYRRVQIDTDLYYQFLYKDGSAYKNDRVKADITSIFEDDTTPRVEYYRTSQKWFIFEHTNTVIKLYVPKSTISENYNIDLE